MKYGLARLILESQAFLELSKEQYEEIKQAKEGLLQVMYIEEKFDLVIENFLELEKALLEASAEYMLSFNLNYKSMQEKRRLFNRRVVNLLTSCRMYADHVPQHYHKIFPSDSDEDKKRKKLTHEQYDGKLGYKVMEALRNHVQHCGDAVHSEVFSGKWDDSRSYNSFSIFLYLDVDRLRQDPSFKKEVLSEIDEKGRKVDLKLLSREYIEGIWEIHSYVRETLEDKLKKWDSVLELSMSRFAESFPEEGSIVGLSAVVIDSEENIQSEINIFKDMIDYRRTLHEKNRNFSNISKRVVTSHPEQRH